MIRITISAAVLCYLVGCTEAPPPKRETAPLAPAASPQDAAVKQYVIEAKAVLRLLDNALKGSYEMDEVSLIDYDRNLKTAKDAYLRLPEITPAVKAIQLCLEGIRNDLIEKRAALGQERWGPARLASERITQYIAVTRKNLSEL